FNADDIFKESGKRPIRAYFCHACGGWHVTSQERIEGQQSRVERYLDENEYYIQNRIDILLKMVGKYSNRLSTLILKDKKRKKQHQFWKTYKHTVFSH